MNLTPRQQLDMFGCSLEHLREMFADGTVYATPPMRVMSIISDVQELIAMIPDDGTGHTGDHVERARRLLNQAKWAIMEYMWDADAEGGTPTPK